MTDRQETEELRGQLAAIVRSARVAILGADVDGLITVWNPSAERMFGYLANEVIGRSTAILAAPGHEREVKLELTPQLLSGKDVTNFETVHQRKDGSKINVSVTLSPIHSLKGRPIGVSAILMDISDRKRAERALERAQRALETLVRGNEALVRATSEGELHEAMCRLIVETGGYSAASLSWSEGDVPGMLRLVAHAGGTHFLAQSACQGQIDVALRSGQALVGVLSIQSDAPEGFEPKEMALLAELADDIAYGVTALRTRADRAETAARLGQAMEDMVRVLANAVEQRDPYTAGHQQRVAEIADAIAAKLGLPVEQRRGLHLAALVHDVGKISVPAEILSRPGKLTKLQLGMVQSHAQAGYDILKSAAFPWPIADIILQHHERLDGSGYPNGLKGAQILFEARILAVADVVEAMSTHRPYRAALGLDAAIAELQAAKGRLYEPTVVEACIQVMDPRNHVPDVALTQSA